MSKQYTYIERRIPATPRNKRLTDAIAAASSTGGGCIGGGGGASYWQLVTTDADGNALAEEDQYLVPVGAYNVMSEMDVVAYSTGGKDIILPIASSSALGAIKVGNGLSIDSNGVLSATGAGSIAGITISPNTGNVLTGATLSADGKTITFTKDLTAITTTNYATTLDTRYVKKSGDTMTGTLVLPYGSADNTIGLYFKNSDATQGAVLRWNGADSVILSGTGYNTTVKNSIYFRPLGTTGPDIMAVHSTNLVDVYGGLHATNDIVAYSTGQSTENYPIASASALGMIKVGANLSIMSDGTLSAQAGGVTSWSELQGKPTTLAGYGITDAAKASDLTSHTGNSDIHVTAANKANWNTAYKNSHTHSNYNTLEDITATAVSNWNTAYSYVHNHSNKTYLDNINQNLSKSSTPTFSGGLVTGSTSGLNIQHSSGNSINGRNGTTIKNLYFNYYDASKNVLVDPDCNIKAYGDVVAYSTGTSSAPFKYWYPSVNSSGVLSWTNSTSTTTPPSVNIKGPKGDKGDSGAAGKSVGKVSAYSTSSASGGSSVYRVYDTSNSLLGSFTVYNGQRGEKGDKGETGATGPTGSMSASSTVSIPSSGTTFTSNSYNGLGVKLSGGNGILGWSYSSRRIGNLYLNNGAPSGVAVKITNYEPVSGSDIRIKSIFYDVPNVLDKIEGISAFYYTLKEDEDKILKIGVSAQAVREVFPEAVTLITPDGYDAYYGVNYMQLLTAVGINGLKELHALVKSQQFKIEELENRIKELESK